MHKCRAETDTGMCGKLIGNKFTFCHLHRKQSVSLYGNNFQAHVRGRDEIIQSVWDNLEDLMKEAPEVTLPQIFNFIEDYAVDEGVTLGRRYIIKWFRETQINTNHPIELTYKENTYNYSRTPYKQILENGIPKSKKKTIIDYAIKNQEENYKQISLATGTKYSRVVEILNKTGLNRGRWSTSDRPKEKAILDYVKENPNSNITEILENVDVSRSHLARISKKYNLEMKLNSNKGKDAIAYVKKNPDCSFKEVVENIGISESRLKIVLKKERVKLKSDEELVMNYLAGRRKLNVEKTVSNLRISGHSLYKIIVKHDLEIV